MTTDITIDTGTTELLCAIRDRVAVITLNRPEVRNALSDDLTPALRSMIKACGENPDVGALLITGAGTAFCAGGNVKGMGAHRDRKKLDMSYDEKVADLQERQRLLTGALVSVRKPTIAALPGPAVGAGLAIAMACDIRIAAQSAFVSTGYLRVGLSGDYGIAWLLTRLVGTSRARELMFTADKVDAARCEAIGLVNRVVPDAKLQDEAFALAKSMAEGPTIALRYMKDNLDEALMFDFATARDHEAERLIRTTMTADHREAVQAFIDKRKAVFVGKYILIWSCLMSDCRCLYCQQVFQPAPYQSQQVVCSQPECQRQRRRNYHRRQVASDSMCLQVGQESAQKWRGAHPDNWKQYRQNHPEQAERNRQRQQRRDQKRRWVNLANNNLAVDLKCSAAEVWRLGPAAGHPAINNSASCQLMIFQSPDYPVPAPSASCQTNPSGALSSPVYTRRDAEP